MPGGAARRGWVAPQCRDAGAGWVAGWLGGWVAGWQGSLRCVPPVCHPRLGSLLQSAAGCVLLRLGLAPVRRCISRNAAAPAAPAPTAALPSLTTVSLASVPNASDDTLRLLGQRHPAVASLALASCGGVTGSGLGAHGAFRALRTLSFDFCDSLTGCAGSACVFVFVCVLAWEGVGWAP